MLWKAALGEESWYSHRSVSSQKWNRQKSPFTDWFCMFCWKAGINPWQKQLFCNAACSSSRQPKPLFTHQSSTTKKREREAFSAYFAWFTEASHKHSCICGCSQRKVLWEFMWISECKEACRGNVLPLQSLRRTRNIEWTESWVLQAESRTIWK